MNRNPPPKLHCGDTGRKARMIVAFALLVSIMALTACQSLPQTVIVKPVPSTSSSNTSPKKDRPAVKASQIPIVKRENLAVEKARVKANLSRQRADSIAVGDQGYYLDVLQGRLLQALDNAGRLHRQAAAIFLDLPNPGGSDQSQPLDSNTRNILGHVAKILVEYRATLVVISVQAGTPAIETAGRPATRRIALAVAHELIESRLPSRRIVASIFDGGDKSAHAADRNSSIRIELQIEPLLRSSNR
ncbi:MAG: hypothetical protein ABI304_01005 [Rudaea sp.]